MTDGTQARMVMMEKSANRLEKITADKGKHLLMQIPQLHKLMEIPDVQKLHKLYRRQDILAALRSRLEEVRQQIREGLQELPDFSSAAFLFPVQQALACRQSHNLKRIINATGVILHTNLGRAPLAEQALAAVQQANTGYCNLEFDLESGERGSRYVHVEELLCRLTGAEAALVVNNCAAAVLLVLSALAKDGEVLASRGELIEIGGGFRMPEVIAQSGARLVEVGTTNKTRIKDYQQAITEHSRLILKSHPSNYRIVGFTAQPNRRELAALASRHGLLLVEDLGSGSLIDLRRFGLPYEPTVAECLADGADIVTFSGDKLLGGPQAGIILGKKKEIARLKSHPLLRALRIDKLALSALEATLRLYELPDAPEQHIPVLRMLAQSKQSVTQRATELQQALSRLPGVQCWTEDGGALPGGGALPQAELPTCLVKLKVAGQTSSQLAQRLREQQPPLIGRISDDCFVIDLRTVSEPEAAEIAPVIARSLT